MTVPDVVVVDHHDSYTWNLVHLVASVTGVLPTVVQHDEVSAEEVLRALARRAVARARAPRTTRPTSRSGARCCSPATRPVLGVCLGMQGLVTAYGGTVDRVAPAHGEVARISHDGAGRLRRAAAAASRRCATTRWRPSTCRRALEVTASDAAGDVVMGVRHVDLPLEGVQFHPESILSEHGAAMVANFLGPS